MPWTQNDWYAAGSLLIWLGFLVTAVWFAHNFLGAMRAFQEQIGALLKLSIGSNSIERHSPHASAVAARSLGEASPYWLPLEETQVAILAEPQIAERRSHGVAAAWRGLLQWLNEPMSTSRISYWRRMISWLQAPVGN